MFELLAARRTSRDAPLTVMLERDGDYPPMASCWPKWIARVWRWRADVRRARMSRPAFEAFFARLYVDDDLRAAFLVIRPSSRGPPP